MPAAPLILILAGAAFYYGGKAVAKPVGTAIGRTAAVVTQPFRHPKKDAQVVKRVVVSKPAILKK